VEFSAILAAVYEECNYASSPAAPVVTRIKRTVNEGVRAMLSEPGLERLADSDAPYTFASVASQARYVLPEAVARLKHVTERTNDHALILKDLAWYRHVDPDPSTNTGTPSHVIPIGRTAVAVQPSDASEIFVDSTSASDVGTAYLEGIITGGYVRTLSVSMTGTTAVSFSATVNSFIEITDFYLSTAAVGTVTLHEDASGGTELARITIGAKRPRYYAFYLWPTPSAVVTYYADYRREITDLVNDTDEPPIATDAHPALVAYAVAREKEKTGDAEGVAMAQNRYARFLSKLKYQTQTLSDEIPVLGRGTLTGRSRLGGMYPADYFVRG
jgi:hypothetical protein